MSDKMKGRVAMPEQPPEERSRNFEEVGRGYTADMAKKEAARCLQCKKPACVAGCPVNVAIPDFVARVAAGDFAGAYETIEAANALPSISGRVCPQESQCEALCVRGLKGESVAIGRLERFAADWHRDHADAQALAGAGRSRADGPRVAVAGSGPAGLTCAADLAKRGFHVTLFEAFHVAGGVLSYGIPEFRLPKDIVATEVGKLAAWGVEVKLNTVVGKTVAIDELFYEGYKAVFVGTGAGLPLFMNIPGESLPGVCSANEYLTRVNLMKAHEKGHDTPLMRIQKAVVVGGGNVAMDAARCAVRLGAEVRVVYRRSEREMPARVEEVRHAREEGVEFHVLSNPVRILERDGAVGGVECVRMELGEPDEGGRRRPVEIPGSEFVLDADAVIMSLGTRPNPLVRSSTPGLETSEKGCIAVGEDGATTSLPGVFAGGDAVSGAATVILAMGAGKRAAARIADYLAVGG